jgi:hypothetical protein
MQSPQEVYGELEKQMHSEELGTCPQLPASTRPQLLFRNDQARTGVCRNPGGTWHVPVSLCHLVDTELRHLLRLSQKSWRGGFIYSLNCPDASSQLPDDLITSSSWGAPSELIIWDIGNPSCEPEAVLMTSACLSCTTAVLVKPGREERNEKWMAQYG